MWNATFLCFCVLIQEHNTTKEQWFLANAYTHVHKSHSHIYKYEILGQRLQNHDNSRFGQMQSSLQFCGKCQYSVPFFVDCFCVAHTQFTKTNGFLQMLTRMYISHTVISICTKTWDKDYITMTTPDLGKCNQAYDSVASASTVYLFLRLFLCCPHPVHKDRWFLANAYAQKHSILRSIHARS